MTMDTLLQTYEPTGEALGSDFFRRGSDIVAKDLLGRYLVRFFPGINTHVVGQIREVAAYQGETDSSSEGLNESAGMITVSRKMGRNLLDIATGNDDSASCITLRAAAFYFDDIENVQGPGLLTEALQIDKDFSGYDIGSCDDLWIEGDGVSPDVIRRRNKSGLPNNCLGYFYVR
jgi:3-methyladenine DNA glycosylase Mpg